MQAQFEWPQAGESLRLGGHLSKHALHVFTVLPQRTSPAGVAGDLGHASEAREERRAEGVDEGHVPEICVGIRGERTGSTSPEALMWMKPLPAERHPPTASSSQGTESSPSCSVPLTSAAAAPASLWYQARQRNCVTKTRKGTCRVRRKYQEGSDRHVGRRGRDAGPRQRVRGRLRTSDETTTTTAAPPLPPRAPLAPDDHRRSDHRRPKPRPPRRPASPPT